MGSPPGRSTLNRFYLFYVSVGVGRPYRGGVFQLWSDECFVGCGFEVLVMNFDIAFEKAQRLCNRSIEWLGSSVVECSHGKRETLGSSPGRATFFFRPCDIWWLSVGPCSGCEQQPDRDCLVGSGMVPSRFGDESN